MSAPTQLIHLTKLTQNPKMFHKILVLFHSLFIFLSVTSAASNNNSINDPQFLCNNTPVPPSTDTQTGIQYKDVKISPSVTGRLYIPKYLTPFRDLPVIIYFHGGGPFCSGSAFSLPYNNFSLSLSNHTDSIILSVEYRPTPVNPITTGYEDSWAAIKWVAGHANGTVDEPWLEDFADFKRVFLAGDGAGANIAHNMAMQVGWGNFSGVDLVGLVLIHPLLWGEKPVSSSGRGLVSMMWQFVCPASSGLADPRVNPAMDPNLGRMGCEKVMVIVAGLDPVAKGNYGYVEALHESGWKGEVVSVETTGKKNGFYLDPNYTKSDETEMMLKLAGSFIN